MQIQVNGSTAEVADPCTLSALIATLALTDRRLAVEVNEELIPRSLFAEHRLAPGDRVEIIHAVGGG
jgi:sulfur carrier protein